MSDAEPSASACSATAPSARAFAALLARARRRRSSAIDRAAAGDHRRADAQPRRLRRDPRRLRPDRRGDGRPRARARATCCARCAPGKHVVTANKQLLSQHGEELWAAAREHGVQLRFEAAVAGVVPVIRVLQESLAAAHVDRIHGIVNGTTNFILTEMAAHRRVVRGRARRGAAARLRRGRPDRGRQRHATPRRRWRSSRGWRSTRPVHLDEVRYEGIEHITADDMEYARELGLGLKLIGTAERVDGGLSASACTRRSSTAATRSRASTGPFNAVTVESEAITEITMSGPGAGGPQTASAVLGDVISAMIPPASTPETTERSRSSSDVESAFYLHLEVADRPGVLAQVAAAARHAGRVDQVGRAEGAGRRTRGS